MLYWKEISNCQAKVGMGGLDLLPVFLILIIVQLLSSRLTGPLLHILITLRWWSLSNVSYLDCVLSTASFQTCLWVNLTHAFDVSTLAGSYVALTVLGRPPGLAQIPLSEAESEMLGVSISSPNSPATERPYSPQDRFTSTQPSWVKKTGPSVAVSCLNKLAFFLCPLFLTSWRYSSWLSVYLCAQF